MEKNDILEKLTENYKITDQKFWQLQKEIAEYTISHKELTERDLIHSIEIDFPQLKVLHESSMRRYAMKTASNSSIIAIIMVIYLIASIIAASSLIGLLDRL